MWRKAWAVWDTDHGLAPQSRNKLNEIIATGSIEENLIGFLAVTETTGEYLTNTVLGEQEKNGLDILNCHEQGYHNEASMVAEFIVSTLNISQNMKNSLEGRHTWPLHEGGRHPRIGPAIRHLGMRPVGVSDST
ncbi:hypothetical protein TNCV_732741 [Trichonephila clavipes]|nr:hypothetical protein TNCV_732741 [Trichonephila clavipes]